MKGAIKKKTVADCEKYVVRDPDLVVLLRRLMQAGKRTFLLTNSEWWYTDAVSVQFKFDFLNFFKPSNFAGSASCQIYFLVFRHR